MTTRRDFLKSAIAIGIAVALNVPLTEASDQQIDAAWEGLAKDPDFSVFSVNEYRTILCPWENYPSYRREIFHVNTKVRSRRGLLREIQHCGALASYYEIEFDGALSNQIPFAVRLDRRRKDWSDWVLKGSFKEHKDRIEAWLNDSIGDEEMPLTAGPVGAAWLYFDAQDYETLDRLGVVVINGEHSGSSYFAAELRNPIEQANANAQTYGIPIRFIST